MARRKTFMDVGRPGGTYKALRGPRKGRFFTRKKTKYGHAHIYGKGRKRQVIKVRAKRKPRPKPKGPPPFNPLRPLTGKSFEEELGAASRLKFGGQERQIEAEKRISGQAQANVGSWWENYRREVEQAAGQTQAAYNQAQTTNVQGIARDERADEAMRRRLQAEGAASAAARGQKVSPDVEAQSQQAAQARRQEGRRYGALIAQQGTAQAGYLRDRQATAKGIRAQELGNEAARRRLIDESARELQGEKGAFRADFRREAREAERKYGLERQAFGLKAAGEASDEALARARIKQTERTSRRTAAQRRADRRQRERQGRRQSATTRRGQNISAETQRRGQNRRGGGGGGGGGRGGGGGPGGSRLTHTQIRGYQDQYETWYDRVRRQIKKENRKLGKRRSRGWHVARLIDAGVPSLIARAAVQRAVYGGVKRNLNRQVRKRYGIRAKGVRSQRSVQGNVVGGLDAIGRALR